MAYTSYLDRLDPPAGIEEYMIHLEHVIKVIGVDHVGFSTVEITNVWNISLAHVGIPEYQVNQDGASFSINGTHGNTMIPALTTISLGGASLIEAQSTQLGAQWDVLFSTAPLVTGQNGALTTANGQVLNINLFHPGTSSLFGFFTANPPPLPTSPSWQSFLATYRCR